MVTVNELVELLMGFPEDEPIYIPVGQANIPVDDAVMTNKGIVLDYFVAGDSRGD